MTECFCHRATAKLGWVRCRHSTFLVIRMNLLPCRQLPRCAEQGLLSQAVRSLPRLQCCCTVRNEQTAFRILSAPPSFCLSFIFLWHSVFLSYISHLSLFYKGTAVAQWLRCCATNRKVAGLIQASVSGFFFDIKPLRSHYGPGVDSASNRNEYQEYFMGVKAAGA